MEQPSTNQPQQRETKQQPTTKKIEQPQAKQQSTSVDGGSREESKRTTWTTRNEQADDSSKPRQKNQQSNKTIDPLYQRTQLTVEDWLQRQKKSLSEKVEKKKTCISHTKQANNQTNKIEIMNTIGALTLPPQSLCCRFIIRRKFQLPIYIGRIANTPHPRPVFQLGQESSVQF